MHHKKMRENENRLDSELIEPQHRMKEISPNHHCKGCYWGKNLGDRIFCPFVAGSCAKDPDTILQPRKDAYIPPKEEQQTESVPLDEMMYKRMFMLEGRTHSLEDWCRAYMMDKAVVAKRIVSGWGFYRALITPLRSDGT